LAHGQNVLVFSADTTKLELLGVNLGDTIPFFDAVVMVGYFGDTVLSVNWKRITTDTPEEWGYIVGDPNITLPPGSSDSSVFPIVIDPLSGFDLQLGVLHESIPGCSNVAIAFSTTSGVPLDTCHFAFRINSDCSGTTAIRKLDPEPYCIVYPNPTSDQLHIAGISRIARFRLLDSSGRIRLITDSQPLSVGHLRSGVYFLHITNDVGSEVVQLIVIE
jgi:hypothetical protein